MIQMQSSENGATALRMMLGYYKRFVPMEEMREICIDCLLWNTLTGS